MDEKVQTRLRQYVELPDGSTAETLDGLRKKLNEFPAQPIYAKRHGRLVLIGWQVLLPGTSIVP